MATANICENCRFWQNQNIIGLCRRYPQHQNKSRIDWCGEWSMALVQLPAVEMPTQVAKVKRKYTRRQDVEAST
jgi:hypothetical protein